MKKEELRIVYLGTPDFAVASLAALVENKFNVVGVVTNPDKPAGRGQKIQESPVKKYAEEQEIPVLQPTKFRDPEFLKQLENLKADLQIIVAFKMLPNASSLMYSNLLIANKITWLPLLTELNQSI